MFDTKAKLTLALLSLTTLITANPISTHNIEVRSASQSDSNSLCAAAANCEIYKDETGASRIRFKPGMEPGTADYARRHSKRDDTAPNTQVTIGDQKIVWGCGVDPVATLGNLSAPCMTTGACDSSNPYTMQIPYFDVTAGTNVGPPTQETLTLSGVGTYPSWMRNGLVEAIQAAASAQGLIQWHNNVQWFTGPAKRDTAGSALTGVGGSSQGPSGGTCSAAVFSTFVGIGVFNSVTNDMQASMQVSVSLANTGSGSGFCGDTQGLDLATAVSSAFGAWGAGIAGILGSVKALCEGPN